MSNIKKSDRTYFNPDGPNTYSAPKIKPKRKRNHRRVKDELDKKEENKEKEMERNSTKETVARLIKARRKDYEKRNYSDDMHVREGVDNFKYKDNGVRQVAKTYKHLAQSFLNMTKAANIFTGLKASEISPDGKLGGKGYIQPIREIRTAMAECLNDMSELLDTFHDEVNSPYWKKTTLEDHPAVKEILQEADHIVDKVENMDDKFDAQDPKNMIHS